MQLLPGTLIARIIDLGISPVRAAFNKIIIDPQLAENGITDSIESVHSNPIMHCKIQWPPCWRVIHVNIHG